MRVPRPAATLPVRIGDVDFEPWGASRVWQ